ncbi:unnamed protein product [Caenorhabditis angaria]|uniref:RRM domain-containing protein n=1 Tax=Caenorhabditis angaria TaxID=860376 RepID=A0A9P1IGE9_9PELO|nr:unnamed protein product [Caenorhabditis angaria]
MADGQFKAYVGNLPYDAIASDVETILAHCDFDEETIRKFDIHLVHDREDGRFKGFGYVTFLDEDQLNKALQTLNGTDFDGRTLKVNRATQRDRGNRNGGNGGGRSGGGQHGGERRGGDGRGGRGGGGFRGGNRDGGHRDGGRNRHNRKSQSDEHEGERRKSENGDAAPPSGPPAERPRLNLAPRTTDPAELAARKAQEEKEAADRLAKIFG